MGEAYTRSARGEETAVEENRGAVLYAHGGIHQYTLPMRDAPAARAERAGRVQANIR